MSTPSPKTWDFSAYQEKQWFRIISIKLLLLIVVYTLLHLCIKTNRYEYVTLDVSQKQQLNRIYFTDSANAVKDTTKDALPVHDSLSTATASTRYTRCLQYLKSEFGDIDTCQVNDFKKYLASSSPLEAVSFLSTLKLGVRSFFWLKSYFAYLEIIFWSLFGVLCSILFNLGAISQKKGNDPKDPSTYFDSSEIPSQVAKMFYAPLCTLIIVFGYNYFSADTVADISSSKGVIIFAFIGGFYSQRLISLLDRLKDVLLPNSGKADSQKTDQASLRNAVIQLVAPVPDADPDNTIPVAELTKAVVTLTFQQDGKKSIARNIDPGQPGLFIMDYLLPGKYTVDVVLDTKAAVTGVALTFKGTQEIEMKDTDVFTSVELSK